MNDFKYIFSDFDGTISKYDVVHRFISTYSKGDWTIAEKKWAKGEISSEECLNEQMSLVQITKKEFDSFLNSIEIDEYFLEFYNFMKLQNKEIIILSDGFDYFIEEVLKKYKIFDVKIYSNKLKVGENKGFATFKIEFPNMKKDCKINAGTCKCNCAKMYTPFGNFIYIGDGLSDRCIAKKAKTLFAKKGLETFCKKEGINFTPFETFKDILDGFYAKKG